jgi:hypothetical protein
MVNQLLKIVPAWQILAINSASEFNLKRFQGFGNTTKWYKPAPIGHQPRYGRKKHLSRKEFN